MTSTKGTVPNKSSRGQSPMISVVIVNYNGEKHLEECFNSLQKLNYPAEKLELILVDNASVDNSLALMEEKFPQARIVRNASNTGFAKGCNTGVAEAKGSWVAFLNNDTKVDKNWLAELAKEIGDDSKVCFASKILKWDGKTVDFVGGELNFYGMAFQKDFEEADGPKFSKKGPLLFACGGAMLINKEVFQKVGGFDEDYFAFFEDVDLGWRLWLFGYDVQYVPASIVFHKNHSTASALPSGQKQLLYERNALFSIIKNYDDAHLEAVLPSSLLLTVRRAMVHAGINKENYYIEKAKTSTDSETIPSVSTSSIVALDDLIDALPALMEKRQFVQRNRQRSDDEIKTLFSNPFRSVCDAPYFLDGEQKLVNLFNLRSLFENNEAAAAPKPQSISELPFDQYQRYMDIQKVLGFFPQAKNSELLDVGGYPGLITRFVNGPKITITDIQPDAGIENYIEADACKLPMKDNSFETLVSLDTLEHIPAEKRGQFLDEIARVAQNNVVITAPFASVATTTAEDLFQQYFVRHFGREFETLKEHQVNGLPSLEETTKHLEKQGFKVVTFPSGSLYNWLLMMLVKTSFWTLPNSKNIEGMFDSLYNTYYYERDHTSPSYRTVIVASKDGNVQLEKIPAAFAPENKPAAAGDASYFQALTTTLFSLRQKEDVSMLSVELHKIHGLLKDKDTHINNLQAIIDDKDRRIRELEDWASRVKDTALFQMYSKAKNLRGRGRGRIKK